MVARSGDRRCAEPVRCRCRTLPYGSGCTALSSNAIGEMLESTTTSVNSALERPTSVVWRLMPVLLALVVMWVSTGVNFLLLHGAWLVYGVRAHDPSLRLENRK